MINKFVIGLLGVRADVLIIKEKIPIRNDGGGVGGALYVAGRNIPSYAGPIFNAVVELI
ncbi:MAG: hypothetical protein PHH11_07535 [Methylomonas sp.]|nr:hypothetical protein [Methylomonas sp.]